MFIRQKQSEILGRFAVDLPKSLLQIHDRVMLGGLTSSLAVLKYREIPVKTSIPQPMFREHNQEK